MIRIWLILTLLLLSNLVSSQVFFISVEAIKGWKDNKVTRVSIIISGTLKRGV